MLADDRPNLLSRGMVGPVAEALERALDGQRLARELHDLELELSGGAVYWISLLGETMATVEGVTKRIERMGDDYELGRRLVGFSSLIWSTFLGLVLTENCHIDDARTAVDRAVRLACEHDDVDSLGWAHNQYAMLDYFSGEVRDGLEHARAGAEIIGSAFSRVIAYCVMGYAEANDRAAGAATARAAGAPAAASRGRSSAARPSRGA